MPDPVPALGFDPLTPLYDAVVGRTIPEARIRRRLIDQAGIRPGDRVLDLGCGTGTLLVEIAADVPDATPVGLDADDRILDDARAKVADAGVDVALHRGLATALPYADDAFDRVVSTFVLHHLVPDDKRTALAEVRRVLAPDGQLHVADWGRPAGLVPRLGFAIVRAFDGLERTRAHADGSWTGFLDQAGFDVEAAGSIDTVWGTLGFHRAEPKNQSGRRR